MITIEESLDWV